METPPAVSELDLLPDKLFFQNLQFVPYQVTLLFRCSACCVLFVRSGEPSADAGRGQCELSHRGPHQCTSAVCPVPPRPPGNRLPPSGVRGQRRRGV